MPGKTNGTGIMRAIESAQKHFNEQYQSIVLAVDGVMESYLQSLTDAPERLTETIMYSIRAGGKRLRPVMVSTYQLCLV